jgi:ubiquinone/menaquinone biosynthesis C-methylase UbiE
MSSAGKDYKNIWNNLSTSFEDAAFYVCCIGDEDEIRKNGALTAEFLKSVLQIEPDDKVLEIGCGVARIGRELAPSCGEWHGVDISGNMIAHAKERTEGIPNIHLHELPDNSLSIFPDESFDCVYSSIVFMHLDKPDMFTYIKEANRVLKPGGRAYFDTYNILAPEAWQEFLKIVTSFSSGERPGHVSQFSSPPELEKFMKEAGFDDIEISDLSPALVVTLGRKSRSVHTSPTDPSLDQELVRARSHIAKVEAELEHKNTAIADLEARLREREADLVKARAPRLPWKRRV